MYLLFIKQNEPFDPLNTVVSDKYLVGDFKEIVYLAENLKGFTVSDICVLL